MTPIVLGSYGLMVNTAGMLESPANTDAPTRQVNTVIEPGGYLARWCRQNGAQASLRMLYRSAYTSEVVYGNKAQQQSGVAQLVPNQKGARSSIVGMSMAPSIWIVNFALVYTLNPRLAAKMPAGGRRSPPTWLRRLRRAPPARFRSASTSRRLPGRRSVSRSPRACTWPFQLQGAGQATSSGCRRSMAPVG